MALKKAPAYTSALTGRPPAAGKIKVSTLEPGVVAPSFPELQNVIPAVPGSLTGPPPSVPVGGALSGGGGMAPLDRYVAELESNPQYLAGLQNLNLTTENARQSLRNAIQQGVIASGYDPTGRLTGNLSGYAGDVDAATLAAAAANPFSTKAELGRARENQMIDLAYTLAARGGGRSGALPAGQSQIEQSFQRGGATALDKLLGAIGQGVGTYTSSEAQARSAWEALKGQIGATLASMGGYSEDPLGGGQGFASTPGYNQPAESPTERVLAAVRSEPAYAPSWTSPGPKWVSNKIRGLGL